MKDIDWVSLAVSQDEAYLDYGICNVYRETNAAIATDGHRIHGVQNLSTQVADDRKFPDYKKLQEQRTILAGSLGYSAKMYRKDMSLLNKLLGLFAKKDLVPVEIFNKGDRFFIKYESEGLSFEYRLNCVLIDFKQFDCFVNFNINLKYFIEALRVLEVVGLPNALRVRVPDDQADRLNFIQFHTDVAFAHIAGVRNNEN